MDKIKTVKIKNLDGSISQETYTIAVDAKNVDMDNGKKLQETIGTIDIDNDGSINQQLNNLKNNKINITEIEDSLISDNANKVLSAKQGKILNDILKKKVYYFNSIADMKVYNLKAGDCAITSGYYALNDGGAGTYKIVNETLTDDSGSVIELNNGLFAKLVPTQKINVRQFGILGNTDITNKIKSLLSYISSNDYITELDFNSETYELNDATSTHIENRDYFKINFNGAQINYTGTTNNEGALFRLFFKENGNGTCEITNGSFDCSSITPDFSSDNIHPISLKSALHIIYAKVLNVKNCNFTNWFFSRCVNSNGVEIAKIENCTGVNCGGRSATNDGDSHGDALYFQRIGIKLIYDINGFVKYLDNSDNVYWYDKTNSIVYDATYTQTSVSVSTLKEDLSASKNAYIYVNNCDFSSYEAVEDMYSTTDALNGCKSGRCGIEFGEYSLTDTDKFLYVNNSCFYNYQRAIHIENAKNVNINVNNSKFLEYGTCILGSGQIPGLNSFNIENTIFDKTIEIRAMSPNYDYIFTGGNNNTIKAFTFNNCQFRNLAGKLILYGKNIPLLIKNSNIEVEHLNCSTNVYIKFENCDIKSNSQDGYKTIYNFNNCAIELGYKHDSNSRTVLVPVSANELYYDTTKYGYIQNCYLKNFGYQFRNNVVFNNNHFVYDANFPGGGSDASKKYCILINNILDIQFRNNIVENSNDLVFYLFNEGSFSDHIINLIGNTIYNLRFSIFNTRKYRCKIVDNLLINSNENITNAFSFYGSRLIANNNNMYGFTTPFSDYSSIVQYNNYKVEDTQATLIS